MRNNNAFIKRELTTMALLKVNFGSRAPDFYSTFFKKSTLQSTLLDSKSGKSDLDSTPPRRSTPSAEPYLQQSPRLVTKGPHSSLSARLTFPSNSDEEEATEGSGTTMPDRITLILLFHLPPPPLLIFSTFSHGIIIICIQTIAYVWPDYCFLHPLVIHYYYNNSTKSPSISFHFYISYDY